MNVGIIDDMNIEVAETFDIVINSPSSGMIDPLSSSAVFTINDNGIGFLQYVCHITKYGIMQMQQL